jgi:hypothetical protein
MGFYINQDSKGNVLHAKGKVEALIADGATLTDPRFKPNLVCVVENLHFDAAAFAYSEEEAREFADTSHGDLRPRTWLVYEHAPTLSGYSEYIESDKKQYN